MPLLTLKDEEGVIVDGREGDVGRIEAEQVADVINEEDTEHIRFEEPRRVATEQELLEQNLVFGVIRS